MNINKKEIRKFAVPLLVMGFFNYFAEQISITFASRISLENLGSIVTVDNFLYSLVGMFGIFSVAFNIKASRAIGADDEDGLNSYIKSIILLNLKIGIIFFIIVLFFSSIFLKLIYGFSGALLHTAALYLMINALYMLIQMSLFAFANLMKVEQKTQYMMYVSVGIAIMHVILSYIIVKVLGFGIIGLGVINMISLVVELLIYLVLTRKLVAKAFKAKANKQLELIKYGIPMFGQEFLEGVIFLIAVDAIVAHLGLGELAIYSVIFKILVFLKISIYALGNTSTVFVGQALGEKNNIHVKQSVNYLLKVSYLIAAFLLAIIIIFNKYVTAFFTSDAKTIANVAGYLPVVVVAVVGIALYEQFKYVLQTLGAQSFVFMTTVIVNIAVVVLLFATTALGWMSLFLLLALYTLNFFVLGIIYFAKYRSIIAGNLL
jgi:Na+-driven multidrug efflux pump